MNLEKLLGQNVVLKGTAKDAKGGAVLITSDNNVIYIKDFDFWPSDLIDKNISVSGFLKSDKIIPDPVTDKDGSISCGAYGDQLVLEDAKVIEIDHI